ncbi:Sec63-domain-containing protein, partial [Caulochytrium protostelioides]
MELSQMVVQAVGPRDPSLRQVPHFTPAVVQRLHDRGVQSVFDLLEMEDADRVAALQLSDAQMLDVAAFANRFPNLALTFVPSATEVAQDDVFTLSIRLERDPDEDEDEDAE